MNLVGFTQQTNGKYIEYLPQNEQFCTDKQKRAIFFNMFNRYMDKTFTFTKKEFSCDRTIEEIFRRKIMSEIDISCIKTFTPSKSIKIDIVSTLLIYAYFTKIDISYPLKTKPFMRVGKLINLIYKPSGLSLMLDLNDMFLHLVYERMKKVNRHANVLLYENSIVIQDKRKDIADTLVIPSYRKIDISKLKNDATFRHQMSRVEKTINEGAVSNIYLVYPKHPSFVRHINITLPFDTHLPQEDYKVKVMPYSFSFCVKTKHTNVGKPIKMKKRERV